MYKLVDKDGRPLNAPKDDVVVTQTIAVRTDTTTGRQWIMNWPESHMKPKGEMDYSVESAALWQFMQQAHLVLKEVPSQVTIEGDQDMMVSLRQIADSVATRYDTTLEVMFSKERMAQLTQELLRIGGMIDVRIYRFIESGGQTNNIYDREPDANSR